MQEIHDIDKHFSQETRKMLFRGLGNANFSGGADLRPPLVEPLPPPNKNLLPTALLG